MSELKGQVSISNIPCIEVTWKVPNFTQNSRKVGYNVRSPPFSFAEASWILLLEPIHGQGSSFAVRIRLLRPYSSISEHSVISRLCFKTDRGEEYGSASSEDLVDEQCPFLIQFHERSLVEACEFHSSKGTMTVFCQLRLKTQPREALLELPVRSGRNLDTSRGNHSIGGNSRATYSASSQTELLNSNTQADRPSPNSQENFTFSLWKTTKLIGQVSARNVPCIEVTWGIPNFAQTSRKINYSIHSPSFFFAEASWSLGLGPNGYEQHSDRMFIALHRVDSLVTEHSIFLRLGLKTDRGEEYRSVSYEGLINENLNSSYHRYKKRSEVEAYDFLIPKGTVIVFCQLYLKTQPPEALLDVPVSPDGSLQTSTGNDDIITGNSAATHLASKPELLNSSSQTDERHPNLPGIQNLQSDYKKLLESEEEADVCLKVSDKEFQAHKCILRARSSVFSAMFKHDTEEKKSGKVVIEDMDPESFPDFLQHVYAGSVDSLTEENVFNLYTAADKYDMADLKTECRSYMERTLSVDTFCDVMVVALRYKEAELLKVAVNFFSKNLARIIVTVKWQKFLKEHDTAANELLIKTFVPPNKE